MLTDAMKEAMQADADRPIPPRTLREDRTSMTFWLPRLVEAGLPVPKTKMVLASEDELRDVWRVFDGEKMTAVSQPLFDRLKAGADALGYPCFLRTSYTSGKHDWDNTCFLRAPEQLPKHVATIIEYGECQAMFGPPHDWWAVREFLPTKPITICKAWSNMPVCREFRAFVRDDAVECMHPYWPMNALEQGDADNPITSYEKLRDLSDHQSEAQLFSLASKAGAACGGYWSVDMLETERGWYITDMAEGEKSFHWEGCSRG